MSDFKQYRRSQIAELAEWTQDTDMRDVSVSVVDKEAGSPKPGDMIARNPKNHADRWLVAGVYFRDNFEQLPDPAPSCPHGNPHGARLRVATVRELLEHLRAGHHPQGQVGAVAYGLAARVEAVLALAEKRHAHEAYDACLAEVRRILNGESK